MSRNPRFTESALNRLRQVGDEQADPVARALLDGCSGEALDEGEVVGRAVRTIVAGLASSDDAVVRWLTAGPCLPTWADLEKIEAGQRFFAKWPMPIATTLFCGALPTTLAAPHGAAVMAATSHMGRRDHVAARLASTGRMLFDVLADTPGHSLETGNQGHVSAMRVRLLHAVVRQALLAGRAGPWEPAHGVPVNQEDLLGTLLAFTTTVLDGLHTLGIPVTDDEEEAYVHTWCAVGALLGIDEALLPLAPDEARELAAQIAERQLGRSVTGRLLEHELLREMRLAMPWGFKGVPAALTWLLAPRAADLLAVPEPGVVARATVAVMCRAGHATEAVPQLGRLAAGPGAQVGRSVLQMYIDREEQAGGPGHLVDAEVFRRAVACGGRRAARRTARRRRRGDVIGIGSHVGPTGGAALAALAPANAAEVDAERVREIANSGFPFWEPVEAMIARNRQITATYADLSARLAQAIAGPGGRLDANWYTFAAWTSRTVGDYIADIPTDGDDHRTPTRPAVIPGATRPPDGSLAGRLTRLVMRRSNGSSFRVLAAGNRVVFLGVGLAVAAFLEQFPDRAAANDGYDERWARFRAEVEGHTAELALADPSWLLTPLPPPEDLFLGFRQFLLAMQADDEEIRSQRVLAANLLLAAYEQRRLDGYVWAALAVRSERAMEQLIHDETGKFGGRRTWSGGLYARVMTRRMKLVLPGEELRISRPIPPPARASDRWHRLATDADVRVTELQTLIIRYQLALGRRAASGARNWTSFDERMRTIGQVFRLRQRQPSLFDDPFASASCKDGVV